MQERSIMWKYIREEVECLPTLWEYAHLEEVAKELAVKQIDKVYYVASGSSLNVAKVVHSWMEKYWNCEVVCLAPLEFKQRQSVKKQYPNTLVIGVSQTGTSRGTLESLQYAKELGYPLLTLTEREDTPIAKLGDYYLNFCCGEEDSNAKTKGYSSNLILVQRLILLVAKYKGFISEDEYARLDSELKASVANVAGVIEKTIAWVNNHQDWANMHDLTVISYGNNYATAMEGSLKLLETMSIASMFIDIEEFSHGTHRAMHKDSRIVLLASDSEGKEDTRVTAKYLQNVSDYVLLVDAGNDAKEDELTLVLPCMQETESSLLHVVVIQVLSVAFPELLDKDPNYPYNQDLTTIIKTRV